MKNLFKVFLITSIFWIPTTSFSAETLAFPDLNYDDPSFTAISELKDFGVIGGYEDGEFKSLNKINRAEFLKIVIEAIAEDDQIKGENCFSDVKTEWFAKYVCYAYAKKIVAGYSDGFFRPEANINFAEASKVVAKAFNIAKEANKNELWYKNFVESIAEKNAIPTSISDLDKDIYRGEMAEVIWRLKENKIDLASLKYEELSGVPIKINSCSELKDFFLQERFDAYVIEESVSLQGAVDSSSAEKSEVSSEGSDDYSETNVQVQGVDEGDIVKNDGKYIYILKDNTVRIVEAYPASKLAETSIITFENSSFYPYEMYLDDDLLVVLGNIYNQEVFDYGFEGEIYLPYFHQNRTAVYIYDIKDQSNPTLKRSFELDGNYSDSRKVDDTLYLVLNKSQYLYSLPEDMNIEELLPRYKDSLEGEEKYLTDCNGIVYFPRERGVNYLIISAIPLRSSDAIESEVMIGDSENIYASKDNLYVVSTNYEYGDFYFDFSNAKTLVYRYSLQPKNIEYEARAKVPGTILNQFSMDEHNGYFRIATTAGDIWNPDNVSRNNLYILEAEKMEITGSIEDIAKGEKIYSTRFLGDRGYMVTFKKTDPLFVFDISDPYDPKILGELKIPGYSDYLHPYDENHLIGFGKDAVAAEENLQERRGIDFAWYQGVKISLFDITDLNNPKELFSEKIGDRGTESEVLYDHKALLFDKSKNLLAFPITVYEYDATPENAWDSGKLTFQGAYVYNLDLENGFDLKGKITHFEDNEFENYDGYWYADYAKEIRRILYIGENLYTVSQDFVKANDMATIEEKGKLEMPARNSGGKNDDGEPTVTK